MNMVSLYLALMVVWAVPLTARAQTVLFTASLRNDVPVTTSDQPLTFDRPSINEGDAFDRTTFTAPADGVYLFMFAVKSHNVTVHLKVNDVIRRSAAVSMETEDHINDENMASNSIMLFLSTDDTVGLFLDSSTYGVVNSGSVNGIFTSFSGAYLFTTTTVAFSAARTIDNPDITEDVPLEFNMIDMNLGAHFDGVNFTVPYDGLYFFTFAAKGDWFNVHLAVNGTRKRSVCVDNDYDLYENSRSNSMVLSLQKYDVVTVYLGQKGYGGLINTSPTGGIFTEFSGILLGETGSDVVGFSATRTIDMYDVITEERIVYDQVDTNVGGGLVSQDTFEPPVDGYYLFTFTGKSSEMAVHLKVGNRLERSAICNVDYIEFNNIAHNAVILRLTRSERVRVWLDTFGEYGLYNRGGTDGFYSQFSGLLLSQL